MKKTAILATFLLLTACGFHYSEGDRTGVINKFSRKGFFCKTWEGEMNMGGFRNKTDSDGRTAVVANIFAFTVEDEKLIPKVKAAMESGRTVTLTYSQEVFNNPCRGSTNYFITAVSE